MGVTKCPPEYLRVFSLSLELEPLCTSGSSSLVGRQYLLLPVSHKQFLEAVCICKGTMDIQRFCKL